jgi:hypothetical protein
MIESSVGVVVGGQVRAYACHMCSAVLPSRYLMLLKSLAIRAREIITITSFLTGGFGEIVRVVATGNSDLLFQP